MLEHRCQYGGRSDGKKAGLGSGDGAFWRRNQPTERTAHGYAAFAVGHEAAVATTASGRRARLGLHAAAHSRVARGIFTASGPLK